MTETLAPARAVVRADSKFFYFHMALICMAVAFVGFVPTYWAPMMQGSLKADPVVHIHGIVFFAWTVYFGFQTWLAASGQLARHRMTGLIGVSLASLMLVFGVMMAIHSMRIAAIGGHPEVGESFAVVPLTNIAFFTIVIITALANTRRPEWHKRLMLLGMIAILGPAVARWFIVYLSPSVKPPPVAYTAGPELTACLLLILPLLHDWRSRGRPHVVYVIGGTVMVGYKLLRIPFSQTDAWHAIAGWVARLASFG
jgi:hypothetical protein